MKKLKLTISFVLPILSFLFVAVPFWLDAILAIADKNHGDALINACLFLIVGCTSILAMKIAAERSQS